MMNMESVNRMMMSGVESAAQMSVGQAILRLVDKIMWIVEKSVQWSLPTSETVAEENGKSFGKPELVRPLPWIVFLPTLLMLRMFRISMNATAFVLGYPQVEPTDMIRVIQRGRRRLRAIKTSGLKSMRQKKTPAAKDRPISMREASKSLAKSIRLTLSTLSCLDSGSKSSPSPPPTKIRVSNYLDLSTPMSEVKVKDEDGALSPKGDVKRKYSELSDGSSEGESDDEPLLSKIERLANESNSDKDYSPNESTTSDLSDSVDSEGDVSISMSEIQELQEKNEMDKAIPSENLEKTKGQPDNELNKLCNEAETTENPGQVVERPQHFAVSGWENGSEMFVSENGVSGETDTAYYSPISWKSVSPELSPDNQNNQIDVEGKPEDLSNGEVNKKEKKDHDRNEACIEGDEAVANGLKEKHRSTSAHSVGSQKHHKHKRGNHGHRKKK